jgi:excisionase family DNA binding protein
VKHDNHSAKNVTPDRRFMTLNAAASRFDCSERTIRRMIANGDLTGYRVGKRLVRVDADEVDRLARVIPTVGTVA